MRRILPTTLGLTSLGLIGLLALSWPTHACAAQPQGTRISNHSLADLMRPQSDGGLMGVAFTTPRITAEERLMGKSTSERARLEEFAAKVSYAGILLLTADRVVRSMDSVLENLKITRPDGTRLRLEMDPTSDGMNVGILVSRPIEF